VKKPTALIVGASSGIGLACAQLFSQKGIRVAIAARRTDQLSQIAADLADDTLPITADISDPDSARNAVATAWEQCGGIDYLVHAAGTVTPAPLDGITPGLWRNTLDVNLSGAFYILQECGLRMRAAGRGSMVAIASDLAFKGYPNFAHYCAAKAGLVGFCRALALELAPAVRVNCICPGPVDTPMMVRELEWFGNVEEMRKATVAGVPLKRMAHPDEIALFVHYVAVEDRFMTGSMLRIDGGTTAG
jgi:NAD(P)-dependent dehydrogenase (short-subunit alcohol dehydrogenase family)